MTIIETHKDKLCLFIPEKLKKKQKKKEKKSKKKYKLAKEKKGIIEFVVIITLVIIGLILGFIGFRIKHPHLKDDYFYLILITLRLFILEFNIEPPIPWPLQLAMVICPGVLAWSTGRTVYSLSREKMALLGIYIKKKHIVVCGLNKRSMYIIKKLRKEKNKVIVIDADKNNTYLDKCRDLGCVILIGDCTDRYMLRRALVDRAEYLIAMENDDPINMEVGIIAYERVLIRKKRPWRKKLKCYIHIKDLELQDLFYPKDIFTKGLDYIDLKIFNIYENSARILFLNFELDTLFNSKEEGHRAHLLIIGFGEMGESVLLQAVKQAHYKNKEKLRITVIDKKIDFLSKRFEYRFPHIGEFCEIKYCGLDIKNFDSFHETLNSLDNEHPITAVIVCFNDKTISINCALSLPLIFGRIKEKRQLLNIYDEPDERVIPIMVELEDNEEIFKEFQSESYPIKAFGHINESCSKEVILNEVLDTLSMKLHNFYRDFVFKDKKMRPDQLKELPEKEQIPLREWPMLDINLKNSNRQFVDNIFIKLRIIGYDYVDLDEQKGVELITKFSKDVLETLAPIEHNRWLAERMLSGWTYSESRNILNRKSPLLKPWDQLNEDHKKKDYMLIEYIPQLLKEINVGIKRKAKGLL